MPRTGENIYHRKDGRWEGRYVKGREGGRTRFGYVYGRTYGETKKQLSSARLVWQGNVQKEKDESPLLEDMSMIHTYAQPPFPC